MTQPRPSPIRFKVVPLDVPAIKAARRLHLTLPQFQEKLPELLRRGFPSPDPTTGMFFLPAIDRWMESRAPLTMASALQDDAIIINARIARL
jgi:hypothetical protein